MSLTFNKFNCFEADKANGKHTLSTDQLTIVLCATANAPVATNTVLTNLTTIDHTNLSTRNITTTSSTQSSGLWKLILANLTLTSSGAVPAFRYAVIYNSTSATHPLIGWIDYGADVTIGASGETVPVTFDQTNGLLQAA